MTNRSDAPNNTTSGQQAAKPRPATDEPGFVDGIPVEELVRLTREFTARITNEDRQRTALELSESGHQRSIQTSAPFLLQQFFTGKVDLDVELGKRYPSSPLLSSATFTPEPGKQARHGFSQFSSQDNSSAMSIELHGAAGAFEVSFLLGSMIGVRFTLGAITSSTRNRFLQLLHRPNGIAFLWTQERWERDYMIFVVRERFARIYAFSPSRFDGACRLTPEGLDQLVLWLTGFWGGEAPLEPLPTPDNQEQPSTPFTW